MEEAVTSRLEPEGEEVIAKGKGRDSDGPGQWRRAAVFCSRRDLDAKGGLSGRE